MNTDKEIRIIEQGSDEARLISKAMASSTASELLDALSERPKTATELETETGYPLPTIQYHMGNLLKAGLVQVSKIRYSEKGKPMKLYAAADTILVISPKKKTEEDIKPVLRKYGFAAAGFILGTAAAATVCGNVLNRFVPQTPDAAGMVKMAAVSGETAVKTAAPETVMNTLVSPAFLPPEPAPVLPDAVSGFETLKEMTEVLPVSDVYSYTYMEACDIAAAGDTADILFSQVNLGLLIFLIAALVIIAGLMIFEIVRIKKI